MEAKRCYKCKFFATVDDGYSNYTVMECTIHCLKKHFEPTAESYSWKYNNAEPSQDHEFWRRAETCPDYKEGDQIYLDAERTCSVEDYEYDQELYQAAKEYDL